VDSAGNLYATGWTQAFDFPIVGAYQGANHGSVDAFVVKLNASGSALIYATYIGDISDDRGVGIAIDSAGNAYVAGTTTSSNFPLVSSLRPSLGGGQDAFVLKLNASGNALLFSTYLGGGNVDSGAAIALDGAANAYVCGDTLSSDFPLHAAVQPAIGGNTDVFLAKLTSAGALASPPILAEAATSIAAASLLTRTATLTSRVGPIKATFRLLGLSSLSSPAARTPSSRRSIRAERKSRIARTSVDRPALRRRACWSRPTGSLSMRRAPLTGLVLLTPLGFRSPQARSARPTTARRTRSR
jgi:hypothetical protein